jgi:hypothetical protein
MHFKATSLKIALTAATAVALGTSVFAQTMVGGQEVSDEDMEFVTVHCKTLTGGLDTEQMGAEPEETADVQTESSDGDEMDAAADASEAEDSDGVLTAIDIDEITMEDCEAAGLAEM